MAPRSSTIWGGRMSPAREERSTQADDPSFADRRTEPTVALHSQAAVAWLWVLPFATGEKL
eukprot:scaffold12262_cov121-Isochrysis_galbana.AAC.9